MTTALRPEQLRRRCDPDEIPFVTTADAPAAEEPLGQARAVDAVELAIGVRHDGYNLFALGPEGIGKRTVVRQLLAQRAASQPTPPDWCYVGNLASPHRPRALRLPPGAGARLRDEMARAVSELRAAMPAAFDSEEYRSRKRERIDRLKQRQEAAIEELQLRARGRQIAVLRTETGLAIAPLRGDEVLDPGEFAQLPEAEQAARKAAIEETGAELTTMFATFHQWGHEHRDELAALDREVATAVARRAIDAVRVAMRDVPQVGDYLTAIEADVVEHAERFVARGDGGVEEMVRRAMHTDGSEDGWFRRYQVNLLVDHGGASGAPIVDEDHPTYANLIGRVEHVPQMGALITDFTLIRAGALHQANGGYLLLDAVEVLSQPFAWDALKRALRSREVKIESLGQTLGLLSTVSLEPEPIPLEGVKLVLFGERLLYYLVAALDPDVAELFKVMADFDESTDRRPGTISAYARLVAAMVGREGLRPFDRAAVARVLDHAARLAGDADKLSIHLRSILDLLREADHLAERGGHPTVTAADVQAAIDGQLRRAGRLRERTLEAIRKGVLLVETSGRRVGQVNGLSVIELGGSAFGQPTRITARARVGDGEVIDLEREVELGGPLHSKGVLILTGLVGARYARERPLSLSATLVFEQSYGGIEGDSASMAELCALLSAIAELPLDQALALTGSVDQHGRAQPIGGVNEKIEGFFDACLERGLTGSQGVLVPTANVQHLMLREDVVAAVAEGRFHVHAIADIDEAMALLTGVPAGARDERGQFPPDSVNGQVEARLAAFTEAARRFQAGGRDGGGDGGGDEDEDEAPANDND